MRILISARTLLVAATFMAAACNVFAGESCEVTKTVNGRMVFEQVPCKTIERPVPCSEETRDERGHILVQERPCRPGEQKTVQQVQREEEAAQKKVCGRDFGKIRVGMSLDRFEQCTDGLVYVTETVSKGRTVETYRSTFYLVHASDGAIVAFTRR